MIHSKRRLHPLTLVAMLCVALASCQGGPPTGPTGPPLFVESINGSLVSGDPFGNDLAPFMADGTLIATITEMHSLSNNSNPPPQCNLPIEATMTLIKKPFPGFCFAGFDCNVVITKAHGVAPLQLTAEVHAGQYDEILVNLGPAPQPSNCFVAYVGTVSHP